MIVATRFPNDDSARRYRSEGFWATAAPRETAILALVDGGNSVATVDSESEWTYQQLAHRVSALSHQFSEARVGPGDSVLIVAPLRSEAVAAYLAAIHSGCIAVLVDRRSGPADIRYAHDSTRPAITVAFDDDSSRLGLNDHGPVLSLDRIAPATEVDFCRGSELLDPDAPAVVLFTSGTTGTPKGVIHTINSLHCGARNMASALGLEGTDRPFLSSPLASITGVVQLTMALSIHACIVFEDRFRPAESLARIIATGATIIGGAPVIVETLFKECERQNIDRLPLRAIALGGTTIPDSLIGTATDRYGIEAVRVYGSSEAPFSTSTTVSASTAGIGGEPTGEPTTDEGLPMPGVEIAIADVDAELLVRGPHQFHGYVDSEHNVGGFDGDWVRTGDQAEIVADRLSIKGRLKEVVARKGMKISLMEIDKAAQILGEIGECVSYGTQDAETGERLVLAIRPVGAPADIDFVTITNALLDAGVAKWKLPEEIVVWNEDFPRTESGKVRRRDVADCAADRVSLLAPRLRT